MSATRAYSPPSGSTDRFGGATEPFGRPERPATLDILSGGRFELGLAKSGGKEWETFGVNPELARGELREALQMIPKMWTEPTFSWDSKLFQMPEREVVPK